MIRIVKFKPAMAFGAMSSADGEKGPEADIVLAVRSWRQYRNRRRLERVVSSAF